MPRALRIEQPEAIYPVVNRGDRRETGAEKTRRILREELNKLNWSEGELARCAKGDAHKVCIARRFRAETSVPWKWIAEQLQMGTWTGMANRLYDAKT